MALVAGQHPGAAGACPAPRTAVTHACASRSPARCPPTCGVRPPKRTKTGNDFRRLIDRHTIAFDPGMTEHRVMPVAAHADLQCRIQARAAHPPPQTKRSRKTVNTRHAPTHPFQRLGASGPDLKIGLAIGTVSGPALEAGKPRPGSLDAKHRQQAPHARQSPYRRPQIAPFGPRQISEALQHRNSIVHSEPLENRRDKCLI